MLRSLVFLIFVSIVLSTSYYFITRVRFEHQRPKTSNIYCKLIRQGHSTGKPVIFIPGIKGSMLSRDGRTAWLSLKQVLFNTDPFIYRESDPPLLGMGIFTRLSFIPGLLEYAPYQRMTATLACHSNSYFFSYDWRRKPMENVQLLSELVTRVQAETGQKPSIVAHSMGGLITHGYLKTHADKIDKVVYVGVPFQPGVGFLPDIDQGSVVGMNQTILSKEAVFSHPSSFSLLPHTGRTLYKNEDLMKKDTWKKYRLSVFRDGSVDEAWFEQTLTDTIAYQTLLDTPVPFSNQFLFVVGNGQDTIKSINIDDSFTYTPGDGRVIEEGAYPVEQDQINKEIFLSYAIHDQQLNDKQVVKRIIHFLESS